jgi:hypothetical protein
MTATKFGLRQNKKLSNNLETKIWSRLREKFNYRICVGGKRPDVTNRNFFFSFGPKLAYFYDKNNLSFERV